MKVSIEMEDVQMPYILLNLNFPPDLLLDTICGDLWLDEGFEYEDILGGNLGVDHIYMPEFPFA